MTEPTAAGQPPDADDATPRRGSALFAALLSALIPGLGQLWAGSRRRALVVAAPFLALVAGLAIVAIALATRTLDAAATLAFVLHPSTLAGLLVLDGILLAYRLVAIVDA